jgi:tetratricopeptide (TPR) repeat protein
MPAHRSRVSPANRIARAASGATLALLLLGSGPAWPAQPAPAPAPADDAAQYAKCLDAARKTPAAALTTAEGWRTAGGGFPADHCAAVALFGLQRYPEAAQRFEALAGAMMTRGPDMRAGALQQAGQAWLLANLPAKARSDFDAALSFTPEDPDLLIDRARADAETSNWKVAVADLDRALALAPGRADALVYRASAWRQLGDLDRARTDVAAALAVAPKDAAGLLERGIIRRLAGDAAGAGADWRQVETDAPGSPEAASAKANLARLGADENKPE